MTIKQHGGVFGRNPTFNTVTAAQFVGPISGLATSAAALKSSATTGLMQITGPAAGATRTMTIPDANFTAARTDAGQTFTGVQVMTSPNIVTSINDTNGNEVFGITATASAVNELTIANAATGSNPTISATGTDTNIGVTITPKGTGNLVLTAGNLVVANGQGIDFSATAGTGTSELFDDYEEGTYTGTLTPSGSGTITVNAGADYMSYTKIGRVVNIHGFLEVGSVLSPVGTSVALNLPFTIVSLPDDGGRFATACLVGANLQAVYGVNGATSAQILIDASTVGSATQFWFSFSYMAA